MTAARGKQEECLSQKHIILLLGGKESHTDYQYSEGEGEEDIW